MKKDRVLQSGDGTNLFLKTDTHASDRAILVMAHGLNEYHGCFDYLTAQFNDAGIGVYRPDHRGHGKSGGTRGHLDHYRQLADDFHLSVIAAIEENPERPVFLYGHSMGGLTVVLHTLLYPDVPVSGIITSGAVVCDKQELFHALPTGEDLYKTFPVGFHEEICSVTERVDAFKADPMATLFNTAGTAYEVAKADDWLANHLSDFALPVLITHGSDDVIVSPEDSLTFFREISSEDRQLKLYGGARHSLFNEFCRDEVIDDMIQWILRRPDRR